MANYACRRNQNHQGQVTGDDTVYTIGWDQDLGSNGITYNSTTKKFQVPVNGRYLVTYSFYLGNLASNHTSGAFWVHGSANTIHSSQEPFAYCGNPYADVNPGGCTGGGSDLMAIKGSMIFDIDKSIDGGYIWIAGRVANGTKQVTIVWDGYIGIHQLS